MFTKKDLMNEINFIWTKLSNANMDYEVSKKFFVNLSNEGIKKFYVCNHFKNVEIENYLEVLINTVYDMRLQDLVW
ncbi:MAG: hypothetical protein SPJ27_04155 [Candidatus Onthovivens sp.]|nr:hypothetical protein [Candidatus Onthovivens sp.]